MLVAALVLIAAPQPVAATGPSPSAESKVTCRTEYELGSRIGKKICATRAQWDQMYKETQEDLRKGRNDRGIAPNSKD
jgi:hypothetical protein